MPLPCHPTLGSPPRPTQTVSAFSPICNPTNCPWGHKAFKGYLGEDTSTWKVICMLVVARRAASRRLTQSCARSSSS